MAAFNVEIRQRVSGAFSDIIYPKAHWGNIDGKPATFAPTAHTHDIDDINATGTPSASNFLRGDGLWATPSVEGGGGGLEVIVDTELTADAFRLTASNLSLQKGKLYNFTFEWKSENTRPVMIVINGIDNQTNYISRFDVHSGLNGGYTVSHSAYTNTSFYLPINSAVNTSQSTIMQGSMYLTEEGFTIIDGTTHYMNGTSTIYTHNFNLFFGESVSSITEISFRNIGEYYGEKYKAGTRFLLYEVI